MMALQSFIDKLTMQLQNPKRRLQYFLISLILIYFIWAFLFLNPLRSSKKELEIKSIALQSQVAEIKQKMAALNGVIKNEDMQKAIAKKQQIELKINKLDQQIAKAHLLFITTEDWIKLKKEIIHQQQDMDKYITLATIIDQPIQAWIPPATDKADPTKMAPEAIYQHQLELRFQADYFSTIQYIARLEKLPWSVYWDSLSYNVVLYPKGEVILKFHIFTHEKSEA